MNVKNNIMRRLRANFSREKKENIKIKFKTNCDIGLRNFELMHRKVRTILIEKITC